MDRKFRAGLIGATLGLGLALAATPAAARKARCLIASQHRVEFSGACDFMSERGDASFAIGPLQPGGPFLDSVGMVSLAVTGDGLAEVRGLTIDGINSRWGTAVRSHKDGACWEGDDFLICVW